MRRFRCEEFASARGQDQARYLIASTALFTNNHNASRSRITLTVLNISQHLIHKTMLILIAPGIRAGQIADEFLNGAGS
jgi:hypothetical protein